MDKDNCSFIAGLTRRGLRSTLGQNMQAPSGLVLVVQFLFDRFSSSQRTLGITACARAWTMLGSRKNPKPACLGDSPRKNACKCLRILHVKCTLCWVQVNLKTRNLCKCNSISFYVLDHAERMSEVQNLHLVAPSSFQDRHLGQRGFEGLLPAYK